MSSAREGGVVALNRSARNARAAPGAVRGALLAS